MSREELVRSFKDNTVNMSTIFHDRGSFTKDELACLAMELFYSAYTLMDKDMFEDFQTDVGTELAERWEIEE